MNTLQVLVFLVSGSRILQARPQGVSQEDSSLVFFPTDYHNRNQEGQPIIFFPVEDPANLVKTTNITESRLEPSIEIITSKTTTTERTTRTTTTTTTMENPLNFVPASEVAPGCANGESYCETVDFYPTDFIEQSLLLDSNVIRQFIRGDERPAEVDYGEFIPGRIRPDGTPDLVEETPVCPASESTIFPRVAKNHGGDWMFVVNQGEYIQGIRVEKCVEEGSPCSISDASGIGLETICRQKYIYRKLLAVDGTGSTVTDSFRLPSCCVCYTRSNFFWERSRPHDNHGQSTSDETKSK